MKLEFKYLVGYLPYKAECSYKEYKDEKKRLKAFFTGVSRTDGIETTYKRKRNGCSGDYIGFEGNNNINDLEFKLHLRPLSDLAKEIAKCPEGEFIVDGERIREWYDLDPSRCNYEQMTYLFKNHYDVFGLIKENLAVDINTL